MEYQAFIPITIFLTIAVITCVAIWQIFETRRAKMSVAREEGFREIAEQGNQTQKLTADRLATIASELGDLKVRTGELERLMKTVE